jgi:hypothetical protein
MDPSVALCRDTVPFTERGGWSGWLSRVLRRERCPCLLGWGTEPMPHSRPCCQSGGLAAVAAVPLPLSLPPGPLSSPVSPPLCTALPGWTIPPAGSGFWVPLSCAWTVAWLAQTDGPHGRPPSPPDPTQRQAGQETHWQPDRTAVERGAGSRCRGAVGAAADGCAGVSCRGPFPCACPVVRKAGVRGALLSESFHGVNGWCLGCFLRII